MSKIEDTIKTIRDEIDQPAQAGKYSVMVFRDELEELMAWAEKVRADNPFLIGDRVKTGKVATGVVIGFAGGGALLVRPDKGKYKDTTTGLWHEASTVERLDD